MYKDRHYAGIPPGMAHTARSISVIRTKLATEHDEMPMADDKETDDSEEADEESRSQTCNNEMPAEAKIPKEHTITIGEPTEVAVSMLHIREVNSVLLTLTEDQNCDPDENEIGDDPMRPRQASRHYTRGADSSAITSSSRNNEASSISHSM